MANEFRLVSPGKDHEGRLPRKYTSDGQGALKNISPPLEWYNVPEGTKRLALVVEDIDAPDPDGPIVPWTHWVVANIPPTLKDLPEGFSKKEDEMGGEYAEIKEGNNDWKVPGGAARSCRRRGIGSSSSSMHWMMISCILDMRFRFGYGFLFGSLVCVTSCYIMEAYFMYNIIMIFGDGTIDGITGDEGEAVGGNKGACDWGGASGGKILIIWFFNFVCPE
ncbi:unnamed protein product [Ilex paraguariensis]|uniref:Phosphatidylethanolamine-binding protein n=1 Tax=Ilex paraguariensis TaxID=185542 RepID=A0ABC8RFY1_9AQUA